MAIVINIAETYTKKPGGRFKKEGPFSGEDFRDSVLYPEFCKTKQNNDVLIVNLDGGYGYATSFLEEAFGGLARKTKDSAVLAIKIISEEEPQLVEKIQLYMKDALKK